MDLYYYAKSVNNVTLQAAAEEKAQRIIVEESAANLCSGKCSLLGTHLYRYFLTNTLLQTLKIVIALALIVRPKILIIVMLAEMKL